MSSVPRPAAVTPIEVVVSSGDDRAETVLGNFSTVAKSHVKAGHQSKHNESRDWLGPSRVKICRPFESQNINAPNQNQESSAHVEKQHSSQQGGQNRFQQSAVAQLGHPLAQVQQLQEPSALALPSHNAIAPMPVPESTSIIFTPALQQQQQQQQQQQHYYEQEQHQQYESIIPTNVMTQQPAQYVSQNTQQVPDQTHYSQTEQHDQTERFTISAPAPPSNEPRNLVQRGGMLWKVPCNNTVLSQGGAKRRWFQVVVVGRNEAQLQWHDPEKSGRKPRSILLGNVTQVLLGHKTKPFFALPIDRLPPAELCFSIMLEERTLDLAANSPSDLDLWLKGLTCFLRGPASHIADNNRTANAISEAAAGVVAKKEVIPAPTKSMKQVVLELFDACYENDFGLFDALLDEYEIDVDMIEPGIEMGDSCLILACKQGHVKIAEICLRFGALNDPHPSYGQTALQAAVCERQLVCAKLLLDTAAPSGMDVSIVNEADQKGNTSLHHAATRKDVFMLQLLLRHGADAMALNMQGQTTIHRAILSPRTLPLGVEQDRLRALQLLLEHGGDDMLNVQDDNGSTALHFAVHTGDIALVRMLLESAANPLISNYQDISPYAIARSKKLPQIMSLLQDYQSWYEQPAQAAKRAAQAEKERASAARQPSHQNVPSRVEYSSLKPVEFDQYFTENGDAYYISRETGASQWEDPSATNLRCTVHKYDHQSEMNNRHGYCSYEHDESYQKYSYQVAPTDSHRREDRAHQYQQNPNLSVGQRIRAELYRARQAERELQLLDQTIAQKECDPNQEGRSTHSQQRSQKNSKGYHQGGSSSNDGDFSDDNVSVHSSSSGQSVYESKRDYGRSNTSERSTQRLRSSRRYRQATGKPSFSGEEAGVWESTESEPNASHDDCPSTQGTWNTRHAIKPSSSNESGTRSEDQVGESCGQDDRGSGFYENPPINSCQVNPGKTKTLATIDAEKYGKYVRMCEMGVPPLAVREKMLMDGISDEATISAVLVVKKKRTQPETSTSNRDIGSAGANSGKVNIEDAHSRQQENGANKFDPASALAAFKAVESCEKYLKMKKMGLQPEQIRHKMLRDGSLAEHVKMFEVAFGLISEEDVTESAAGPPPSLSIEEALARFQDLEKSAKYLKMKKMGLQPMQIKHKMVNDNCEAEMISLFEIAFGIAPPPGPSGGTRRKGLVRLHWNPVQVGSTENTVWANGSGTELHGLEHELEELEEIFAAKSAKQKFTAGGGAGSKSKKKPARRSVVSSKRESNVSIGLSQFRKQFASYDLIATALETGDCTKLDLQKLELLQEVLPSRDEGRAVLSERKKLGDDEFAVKATKVESFFSAMCNVDSAENKVKAMLFVIQFDETRAKLMEKLDLVISASEQVRGSTRLQQLFKLILSIGNFMSGGASQGFTLDSLLKLRETRGSDATSVIDYLCKLAHRKGGDELLNVDQDLLDVRAASKLVPSDLSKMVREAAARSDAVERLINGTPHLQQCEFARNLQPKFSAVAEALQGLVQKEARMLEEVKETISYLGESSSCTAQHMFAVLSQFVDMFLAARQKLRLKIKREERERLRQQQRESKLSKVTQPGASTVEDFS